MYHDSRKEKYHDRAERSNNGHCSGCVDSAGAKIRLKKQQIRREMLGKRDSLDSSFVLAAENCLKKELGDMLLRYREKSGRTPAVMSYMSFRNEFPTHSFNRWLLASGMRLILPRTDRDFRIHACLTKDPDHLVRSSFGAAEPDERRCPEVTADEPDFIILPGVAFDRTGNRIGFGRGCYDRFLCARTRSVKLIAAAYLFQISETPLPAEENDIPADCIVTERGIVRCRQERSPV